MNRIRLDTSKLDALIASVPQAKKKIIDSAAHSIEGQAKENIRRWGLIDTGAMINSLMVEDGDHGSKLVGDFGDYEQRKAIGGMTHYAVYWELGHRNLFLRRYVRKPFLLPAVLGMTAKYEQMIRQGLIG